MKYSIILFLLFAVVSCSTDDNIKDFRQENDEEIQAFIEANNLNAQKSNSGLYYVIDTPGAGVNPITTDRVKVAYKGYFTNGDVFDESDDDGISFNLQDVITGWTEGITYFKEGGSGKLLIPSHLAYGSSDNRGIPGGSVLIFDVELIYVNYKSENEDQIQAYISENNITTQKTETGLHYTIHNEGTGNKPTLSDNVSVTYKGYFLNGTTFDESFEAIDLDLQQVIPGFSEGLTKINEGGSATFYIPAHLAYGNNGISGIPGGSVVIFDVELKKIN